MIACCIPVSDESICLSCVFLWRRMCLTGRQASNYFARSFGLGLRSLSKILRWWIDLCLHFGSSFFNKLVSSGNFDNFQTMGLIYQLKFADKCCSAICWAHLAESKSVWVCIRASEFTLRWLQPSFLLHCCGSIGLASDALWKPSAKKNLKLKQ